MENKSLDELNELMLSCLDVFIEMYSLIMTK